MNKEALEELEKAVMDEVVKRRRLGGFDANAETILRLTEWMLKMVQHERESARTPRRPV